MSLIVAIVLGLVQGLTEFIPISSSGHLLLTQHAFGVEEAGGLTFDVALHIGTFIALIVYFYKDIWQLIIGFFVKTDMTNVARWIAVATIPAVIAGYLLQDIAETTFRSPLLVSINLVWMALLMIGAEKYSEKISKKTDYKAIKPVQAILIGLAQTIALIPGVSRSGSTITTGIFTGLDRVSATKFSFLLAIPITFGAIIKVMLSSGTTSQISSEFGIFVAGIIAAFISGFIAIKFLLKYLSNHTLRIFAYYRIGLGLISIALILLI